MQELYNIFSFYTLHGNPLDPEHIRVSGSTRFHSLLSGMFIYFHFVFAKFCPFLPATCSCSARNLSSSRVTANWWADR